MIRASNPIEWDRVVCINLRRRVDRWLLFLREYPPDMPRVEQWEAIDGSHANRPRWHHDTLGAWGLLATTLQIFDDCLQSNCQSVLIFEDDAVPCGNWIGTEYRHFIDELPDDAQWVYLAGNCEGGATRHISEHVYAPVAVGATHCYGVIGLGMIQRLRDLLADPRSYNRIPQHIDQAYMLFCKTQRPSGLYCPSRWLFNQRQGYSDIESKQWGVKQYTNPQDRQ
jgi:hypothetical protein